MTVEREALRRYLSARAIPEADIGGSLSAPLSPADSQAPRGETAKYFVIHDTSAPNYVRAFPADINAASWSGNSLRNVKTDITHVYVNRVGDSRTVNDFGRVLPSGNYGTKFVCCNNGERRKGQAIHVELIQPRHCDPSNGRCVPERSGSDKASGSSNDNIAPSPGFTKAQLDRLALLYVAASVRKGEWLIPSFHMPMDAKIFDAHDDPQNFDIAEWADSLKNLLSMTVAGSAPQGDQLDAVIVDSQMSEQEAFDGLDPACPAEIRNRQKIVEVTYYSDDGKLHRGQLVVDGELEQDVRKVFEVVLRERTPIHSVIPASHPRFRRNGRWDDDLTMEANNTSAFNYRLKTGGSDLSYHAYGRAIDINPFLNPYVSGRTVLPRGARYDRRVPGTFTANHPVVRAFIALGWRWGGNFKRLKDYQHFEKPRN